MTVKLLRFTVLFTSVSHSGCRAENRGPVIGASEGPGADEELAPKHTRASDAGDASLENDETWVEEDDAELVDISTLHADTRKGEPLLGLSLDVAEKGPGLPWAVAIVNEGKQAVNLVADSRLLWFEVRVPGKRTMVTCRLPDNLMPKTAERRLSVVLEPGEGVVEPFDARLYCFAAGGQKALVPGALVTPYFGWPEKKKFVWQRGQRKAVRVVQSEPFVATLNSVEHERARGINAPAADASAIDADKLKLLTGQKFALRSAYKDWSSTRLAEDNELRRAPGPLELKMAQGSDAHAERNATVSLTLKNRSGAPQQVYFRRELVSFEVMGPDGLITCDAQPDDRAPDRSAFSALGKAGSLTVASRLIELCPQDSFARPGLYLVHARFDATESGESYGLDAFTGRAVSLEPALVRIRTGELPFLKKQLMRPISVLRGSQRDAGSY